MGNRFVSAVALYGPKADPLRDFLTGVQGLIAEQIGGDFRPYSLEQIHTTLIALDGIVDAGNGLVVNAYYDGAPADALGRAANAVRERLASDPVEMEIGIGDVKIVASDSHTLLPALLVSDIPADEAAVRRVIC